MLLCACERRGKDTIARNCYEFLIGIRERGEGIGGREEFSRNAAWLIVLCDDPACFRGIGRVCLACLTIDQACPTRIPDGIAITYIGARKRGGDGSATVNTKRVDGTLYICYLSIDGIVRQLFRSGCCGERVIKGTEGKKMVCWGPGVSHYRWSGGDDGEGVGTIGINGPELAIA